MKLLFVATFAHPDHFGGAERVIAEASARLARRGHEVTLLTSNPGEAAQTEDRDGVAWHRYDVDRSSSVRFYRSVFSGVRRALRSGVGASADVQSLHQLISGVAAMAPGVPRRPTVLTFHAPYHEEFLARHRNGRSDGSVGAVPAAVSAILRQGDRYLVRRCHEVLVLSGFARSQVEALDPSVRVTPAPAGVDTDRFAPPADEAERRACLQALGFAPDGAPLIVTVRRLVPRMGLTDLLEAAGKLGRPFRLAIAGEGPERAALEAHLATSGLDQHVRLLGRLPEDQLPALYRAASMFVLPTRSLEGFGMATVEALASGLPVIATSVAANIEVLRGVAGATLVPPNDPAALAAAMETWLADPTAAAEAGLASRSHACSTLSWDQHLDAFEQAAERALATGARA